jgi:hypothetical protein
MTTNQTGTEETLSLRTILEILDEAEVSRSAFWAASADWRGVEGRTDPRPMRTCDVVGALAMICTGGRMERVLEACDRVERRATRVTKEGSTRRRTV